MIECMYSLRYEISFKYTGRKEGPQVSLFQSRSNGRFFRRSSWRSYIVPIGTSSHYSSLAASGWHSLNSGFISSLSYLTCNWHFLQSSFHHPRLLVAFCGLMRGASTPLSDWIQLVFSHCRQDHQQRKLFYWSIHRYFWYSWEERHNLLSSAVFLLEPR